MIEMIVFAAGDDGEWNMVKPEDVPEWVKCPLTVTRLLDGEECKVDGEPLWYRAMSALEYQRLATAQAKRERRQVRHLH